MTHNQDKTILDDLFKECFQKSANDIQPIAGGGSSRRYYRILNTDRRAIGVISEESLETEAFLSLNKCLEKAGILVPRILKIGNNRKSYLLQDLGDTSLFSLLNSKDKRIWAEKALQELVRIQTLPIEVWKDAVGYKPFSERLVRWDLNYFKYDFLKPMKILFDEDRLEDNFDTITKELVKSDLVTGLMYRDYQSRNIMVKEEELYFIDFQGARKGPLVYDASSFIWQAKAPFSFEERKELMKFYSDILGKKINIDEKKILYQLQLMSVFRTLQVLGAYGFRGLIEKKPHFIESIPLGIRNLDYFNKEGLLDKYDELKKIADKLEEVVNLSEKKRGNGLIISVYSFSYKKGYPEGIEGNGGGFMFDCRAIDNPGRYVEYRTKTGKDEDVITFLERGQEAAQFIENAYKIVEPSIEKYLERGFTSLQVGFGCTGGQHRSVYCAEKFASVVKSHFPNVRVELNHREQQISQTI